VFLALKLQRPLFLEGEAGVGKTEVAKVLARWTGGELLRLQCYDGIDVSQAVYEWDYARQLLHLRAAEARGVSGSDVEDELYSERFLVRRPLLQAIAGGAAGASSAGASAGVAGSADGGTDGSDSSPSASPSGPVPVLLIDELDRADDEFEAFLLEILSDYTITIPELGTFRAQRPPIVVITSNRTRDVHDALKRRCLYHWVEHPDFEREVRIVELRVPGIDRELASQVASAVAQLRTMGLYKVPGVAETIDWALALSALQAGKLDETVVDLTLGSVLKYREDAERVRHAGIAELVRAALDRDR